MSFIKLTHYTSTGTTEEIRINPDHIRACRKDCVDFKTVVHIGDTLKFDIKETPEEIDKLIEDANNPKPIPFEHNPEARKALDLSEIVRIRKNTTVMKPLQ